MGDNPWNVDSIEAFSFLKCPECIFDTKEVDSFRDHAFENHPLSYTFFGKKLKEEDNENGEYNSNYDDYSYGDDTKDFNIKISSWDDRYE